MASGPKRFPWPVGAAAAFVLVFSGLFAWFVFDHSPHIHDEISYLFQARLFASGRLSVPSPCAPDFFDFPHTINNGRWHSMYTFGYPLLLAGGVVLGAPWLLNPLLGALTILLFYALGLELYGRATGVLAALLGAASIWLLLMSSSLMNHTSSLFFAALFLLYLFRSLRTPSLRNGLLAGLGLGAMIVIRPYNALIFSFPFLAFYAWTSLKAWKARAANILAAAGGTAVFLAALAAYNQLTNGSPFLMGYSVVFGDKILPGFGNTGLAGTEFNMLQGWENIFLYLKALNRDLFGWPLTSLWALFPLLFVRVPAVERRKDLLLASGALSMLVGLLFFWGVLVVLGPRLMYETVVLFVLLSARGVLVGVRLGRERWKTGARTVNAVAAAILVLFVGHGLFVRFPRWVWPKDTSHPLDTIGRDFAGTTPAVGRALERLPLGKALVFMRILRSPSRFYPTGIWSSGFMFNDPGLRRGVIYARDQGPEDARLMACHPDRRCYLYLGTLEKGFLAPLERADGALRLGPPIVRERSGREKLRLVARPQDIFEPYAPEFASFLDEIGRPGEWTAWDVPHLLERGLAFREALDHRRAAFAFEAALQVETDPLWRETLLNLLQGSYFKLGLFSDAETIRRRMTEGKFDPRTYYNIFPKRGF